MQDTLLPSPPTALHDHKSSCSEFTTNSPICPPPDPAPLGPCVEHYDGLPNISKSTLHPVKRSEAVHHVWLCDPMHYTVWEFSRPQYWSGQPFPSPDLPSPGTERRFLTLQADSVPPEPPEKPKATGEDVAHPFSRGCSQPRHQPGSPTL